MAFDPSKKNPNYALPDSLAPQVFSLEACLLPLTVAPHTASIDATLSSESLGALVLPVFDNTSV